MERETHDDDNRVNYTDVVSGLLQDTTDWINIQDIIKLTFKSVFDVIKSQSDIINDMQSQIILKANTADMLAFLSEKPNKCDLLKITDELQLKPNKDDIQKTTTLLRNDLELKIGSILLESTTMNKEAKESIQKLSHSVDTSFEKYVKSANYDTKINEIERKMQNIIEDLDTKPNKASINNVLHRKANRADIDTLLLAKVDKTEIEAGLSKIETKIAEIKSTHEKYCEEMAAHKEAHDTRAANLEDLIANYQNINKEAICSTQTSFTEQLNQKLDKNEQTKAITELKIKLEKDQETTSQCIKKLSNSIDEIKQIDIKTMQSNADKQSTKIEIKINEEIGKINSKLQQTSNTISSNIDENKKTIGTIKSSIENAITKYNEIDKQIFKLQETVELEIKLKATKQELENHVDRLISAIDGKVEASQIQSLINAEHMQLLTELAQYKNDIDSMVKMQEEHILALLDKKVSAHEVNGLISSKVDITTFNSALKTKLDNAECDKIKSIIELHKASSESKLDEKHNEIAIQLEDLNKEMLLKANVKDVCTLLDMKANIDDINKALLDIHKSIEATAKIEDITKNFNEQAIINEALCSENCVGRWIWKSGELKSGYAVPWEVQSVNTCPDNYTWEIGKSIIIVIAPGLYEVMMGFYASKKPTVQLLVNGEPVVSATNSNARYAYDQLYDSSQFFFSEAEEYGSSFSGHNFWVELD